MLHPEHTLSDVGEQSTPSTPQSLSIRAHWNQLIPSDGSGATPKTSPKIVRAGASQSEIPDPNCFALSSPWRDKTPTTFEPDAVAAFLNTPESLRAHRGASHSMLSTPVDNRVNRHREVLPIGQNGASMLSAESGEIARSLASMHSAPAPMAEIASIADFEIVIAERDRQAEMLEFDLKNVQKRAHIAIHTAKAFNLKWMQACSEHLEQSSCTADEQHADLKNLRDDAQTHVQALQEGTQVLHERVEVEDLFECPPIFPGADMFPSFEEGTFADHLHRTKHAFEQVLLAGPAAKAFNAPEQPLTLEMQCHALNIAWDPLFETLEPYIQLKPSVEKNIEDAMILDQMSKECTDHDRRCQQQIEQIRMSTTQCQQSIQDSECISQQILLGKAFKLEAENAMTAIDQLQCARKPASA